MYLYCLLPLHFPLQRSTRTPHLRQRQLLPLTKGFLTPTHNLSWLSSHHLSCPPQGTGGTRTRAAFSACPTIHQPGRAAPIQPPAWLTSGHPGSGSEFTLLLSDWLPEGKVLERKRKKEGTEPERPLQVFSILRKHPDEPTLERPPPCSMVAVLPAETTLNAEEHFKTQS